MSDHTPDSLELLDGHRATVTNGKKDVYIYYGKEHSVDHIDGRVISADGGGSD